MYCENAIRLLELQLGALKQAIKLEWYSCPKKEVKERIKQVKKELKYLKEGK